MPALVVALLLVACFGPGCAAPAPALEVMTFNVRYANPGDGPNAWEQRADLVFAVLERHGPDLVGLQEALPEQLAELRAAFPGYRVLGQGRDGGAVGEHSALMVRSARLEVVQSGDFWLSPTPDVVGSRGWDAALPRMCTWALLRDRLTRATFLAMNTHFDHRGSEARRESADVILQRRARHDGVPVLVTGDLNAGEDAPPLDVFRAGGLRDTFRDVHPDATDVGTFTGFEDATSGAKIDYVLADDAWSTLDARILRDRMDGRPPSDHDAVVATLVLRRASTGSAP